MRFQRASAICLILASVSTCFALAKVRVQTVTLEPFVGIQVGEISPRKGDLPIPRTYFATIAVRSDGSISRVTKWEHSAGGPKYMRSMVDATAKTSTLVDPVTESVVAASYNHFQTVGWESCEGTPAGQQQGFDVVYSESAQTMEDGSTISGKEWKAPALGCYPIVQEWIDKRGNGELIGVTKHSLVHIKLGEPDPWYFEVPTAYTVRTGEEWQALIVPMLHN